MTGQLPPRKPSDSGVKDILEVAGRPILTLTKRLPEIAHLKPVKVAVGLVKGLSRSSGFGVVLHTVHPLINVPGYDRRYGYR